uniref:Uncharacterized protein n=1 Tax=Cucumis melo TaxID=3656 RepID=A0A9I9DNB6_CUCME
MWVASLQVPSFHTKSQTMFLQAINRTHGSIHQRGEITCKTIENRLSESHPSIKEEKWKTIENQLSESYPITFGENQSTPFINQLKRLLKSFPHHLSTMLSFNGKSQEVEGKTFHFTTKKGHMEINLIKARINSNRKCFGDI